MTDSEMHQVKKGMAKKMTKSTRPNENTLVVIRHGSTALNKESSERIRGWADVPLSKEGEKEAAVTGKKLKNANIAGIFTSDFKRAVKTAEIVSKHTGAPIVQKTKALRPWHLGNFTGKSVKEILPQMQDFISKTPGKKVPGGESFDAFKKRFIKGILEIQKKYPKDKIAIVTHHRGERLMEGWAKAGMPEDPGKIDPKAFMVKGIKPGGFITIEVPPPQK